MEGPRRWADGAAPGRTGTAPTGCSWGSVCAKRDLLPHLVTELVTNTAILEDGRACASRASAADPATTVRGSGPGGAQFQGATCCWRVRRPTGNSGRRSHWLGRHSPSGPSSGLSVSGVRHRGFAEAIRNGARADDSSPARAPAPPSDELAVAPGAPHPTSSRHWASSHRATAGRPMSWRRRTGPPVTRHGGAAMGQHLNEDGLARFAAVAALARRRRGGTGPVGLVARGEDVHVAARSERSRSVGSRSSAGRCSASRRRRSRSPQPRRWPWWATACWTWTSRSTGCCRARRPPGSAPDGRSAGGHRGGRRAGDGAGVLTFTFGFGMAMEMFTAAEPWPVSPPRGQPGSPDRPAAAGRLRGPRHLDRPVWRAAAAGQPGERWLYNTGAHVLSVLLRPGRRNAVRPGPPHPARWRRPACATPASPPPTSTGWRRRTRRPRTGSWSGTRRTGSWSRPPVLRRRGSRAAVDG